MRRINLLAAGVLGLLCMAAMHQPACAVGVEWMELTLDEALAEAAETGQIIMINVHADHCGSCGDMEEGLWNTADGANLAEGLIPIRIDSTTPEGAALNRRYPVTGLPLVLFLTPEGKEIDRVVGYFANQSFLYEAEPLATGFDPLPQMEEKLATSPDSLPLIMEVYERYLFRMREAEAEALLQKILELDPQNRSRQATAALIKMAKHRRIVHRDQQGSWENWKIILDRFPNSTAVGGAVNETFRAAVALGQRNEWIEWMCAKLDENPNSDRLQFSAAMTAKRSRLRGSCWAEAARRARALGKGGPDLDSLAVVFEGGS